MPNTKKKDSISSQNLMTIANNYENWLIVRKYIENKTQKPKQDLKLQYTECRVHIERDGERNERMNMSNGKMLIGNNNAHQQ